MIEKVKHKSHPITQYINSIPTSSTQLEQLIFDTFTDPNIFNTSTSILTYTQDNKITGLLVYKPKTINHKKYLTLDIFHAQSKDIYNELLTYLLENDFKSYEGILTNFYNKNHSDITEILLLKKFKLGLYVYSMESAKIKQKLTNTNKVYFESFTQKTKTKYKTIFLDFLIEHDIHNHIQLNDSYNKSIFKTSLKNDKAHRVKLHYFIESILKSPQWNTFILIHNNEPIGFVKGKINPKSESCFFDLYIQPSLFSKYSESAIQTFIDNTSNLKYLNHIVPHTDKSTISTLNRFYNKPLGQSYFLLS